MSTSKSTDVLIVGSGISGLSTALLLPDNINILIITKDKLEDCSTAWAQGGIASVLSETDSYDQHISDTINNGHGLVNKDIAKLIIENGPLCIKWLEEIGVIFNRDNQNQLNLTLEGAHSHRRIAHVNDETGRIIHQKLKEKVLLKKNINILSQCQIIDLISTKTNGFDSCIGAYIFDKYNQNVFSISADKIILATGGASKIYKYTSNPRTSTGDGIAVAWRAGCRVVNMEFIQFHPTCLYHPQIKSFLISESLRGEGGKLFTPSGDRFMHKYDSRAELASRDIVARAIDHEMKLNDYKNVFLDITDLPSNFIKKRFPKIYEKCLSVNIDITRERIPVIPASHYSCGGVMTDVMGRTDIHNLHVIGESAYTGFHGANRLASNSLLECLVMSKMCSKYITDGGIKKNHKTSLPSWDDSFVSDSTEKFIISHNWDELRKIMWNYVGIVRSNKQLKIAQDKIELIEKEINEHYYQYTISNDLLELRNIIHVSKLIIQSAIERKESRGLHYSIDYPNISNKYQKNTVIKGRKNNYELKLVKFRV
tara:strand:- start:401 stop:2020 length:1620 start_codon:yes stop_codon:yes gene_type:complete